MVMYQDWFKKYDKIIKQSKENDKKMKELLDKFMKNSNEIIENLERGAEITIRKNKEDFIIYQKLTKKIK